MIIAAHCVGAAGEVRTKLKARLVLVHKKNKSNNPPIMIAYRVEGSVIHILYLKAWATSCLVAEISIGVLIDVRACRFGGPSTKNSQVSTTPVGDTTKIKLFLEDPKYIMYKSPLETFDFYQVDSTQCRNLRIAPVKAAAEKHALERFVSSVLCVEWEQ